MVVKEHSRSIEETFDLFCAASSFESILIHFNELCDVLFLNPSKHPWNYFEELSSSLKFYWKADALFTKLEKRVKKAVDQYNMVCRDINVLVVGCGPCGLRCAIELALLGARVIIVEKRHSFSRNNVLHLWPYLIEDLKALGAKTFFGKFCAGSIDHISIRTLQFILLKVALLFGVQVYPGVTYEALVRPDAASCTISREMDLKYDISPDSKVSDRTISYRKGDIISGDTTTTFNDGNFNWNHNNKTNNHALTDHHLMLSLANSGELIFNTPAFDRLKGHRIGNIRKVGWHVQLKPEMHALKDYPINVLIGADGKRSCLGFPNKELRCRLAIAITANFINHHTPAEAKVQEISGVARVFNQSFFARLATDTGIDLENIVYYKDETHYFVMTAKKHSLLTKGVLKQDRDDSVALLNNDNVDKVALQAYAREAADYVTNGALPRLDFALNAHNEPDVDAFDFTRMFAAEYSCRILQQNDCLLLQCLVGDGLYEPFWPTGSGCALGFLSALDAAWSVSLLAGGMNPLKVIALRESVYQHLSQTTPQNMPSNFGDYTLDPMTRYARCDMKLSNPNQVKHLYIVNPDVNLINPTGLDNNCEFDHIHDTDNIVISNLKLPTKIEGQNGYLNDHVENLDLINYWFLKDHFVQRDCLLYPMNNCILRWFQIRLSSYLLQKLCEPVCDFTVSVWGSGRNILCLIHRYRPDLLPDLVDLRRSDAGVQKEEELARSDLRLTRAFNLLVEHFFIDFNETISDVLAVGEGVNNGVGDDEQTQATIYPRSDSLWFEFLIKIYRTFCVLEAPTSKRITSTKKTENAFKSRNRSQTPQPLVRNEFNALISSKLSKLHDSLNGANNVKRNINHIVEQGLTTKRRDALVAMLNNSLRTNSHPRAKSNCSNVTRDESRPMKRTSGRLSSSPTYKPTSIVQNVVRAFAPRRSCSVCYLCDHHLNVTDRTLAFGYFLHRQCFRCSLCNVQLDEDTAQFINTENKAKFYCSTHITKKPSDGDHKQSSCQQRFIGNTTALGDNISTKDKNVNHVNTACLNPSKQTRATSTASFISRLQAGQFPFRSNLDKRKCTADVNVRQGDTKYTDFLIDTYLGGRNQVAKSMDSALLVGRKHESEEIMGIVNLNSRAFNIGHNLAHSAIRVLRPRQRRSNSTSTNSSSDCHSNNCQQRRHVPFKRFYGISQSGIRDEPAPGPDCYLAEHLGLPEVERRANWELNKCTIWPDATVKQLLDHTRNIRSILIETDDYFASSESETPCSSDFTHQQGINMCPKVTCCHRLPSSQQHKLVTAACGKADCTFTKRQFNHSEYKCKPAKHRPIEPSISAPTLCATTVSVTATSTALMTANLRNFQPDSIPPFSSPTHQQQHQSRMAAKQRFCLEAPRPFTIDPLSFIAKRNSEHIVNGQIEDCVETLELIEDWVIARADLLNLNRQTNLVIMDLRAKVKTDSIQTSINPQLIGNTDTVVNAHLNSDQPMAFAVYEDIQDIDANSENSCVTYDRDSDTFVHPLSPSRVAITNSSLSLGYKSVHADSQPFHCVHKSRSINFVPHLKSITPRSKSLKATLESDLDTEFLDSRSFTSNSSVGHFPFNEKSFSLLHNNRSVAYSDGYLNEMTNVYNFDNVVFELGNNLNGGCFSNGSSSSSDNLISPIVIKPILTNSVTMMSHNDVQSTSMKSLTKVIENNRKDGV